MKEPWWLAFVGNGGLLAPDAATKSLGRPGDEAT